jgi:chromosome segregation ATPase
MAGTGLDEGVSNLERFIEGLRQASAQLGEATSALESASGDLERLEGEAQDAIGGATGDIEDAADTLEQALDDAREAVEAIADAAEDAAGSRLPDAQDEIDESAGDCEEEIAEGRAALDEGFARLGESGFGGYQGALEEATAAAGQADDSNREAFDGLEQATELQRGRLDDASSEATETLAEAASELDGTDEELQAAFAAVTSEWRESIDEQLREGCTETGESIASAYGSWAEEVLSTAESLAEQLEDVVGGAAEFVGAESGLALGEARESHVDEPASDLLGRLDDTQQTLEAGQALASALDGMVPELQKSLNVIDQVDRLLNALE